MRKALLGHDLVMLWGYRKRMAGVGAAMVVLAAGGCGGSSSAPPAKLPHALGVRLAGEADAIKVSLSQGNSCTAARQARQLRQAVTAAGAAGDVPALLQKPLSDSVVSLAAQIRCVPPAKTPPVHKPGREGDKHGNGNGDGNSNGNGGGGD